MQKIIAIGTSNSSVSINKTFAEWAAKKVKGTTVEVLDLNEFVIPMFSPDFEQELGIPNNVIKLKERLNTADAFVVSMAEYNGNYTPVFKNTQDWLSRIDRIIWGNKPVFLLSTSPGKMGASNALRIAKESFPHMGAIVSSSFSLPEFYKNFDNGIVTQSLIESFSSEKKQFEKALKKKQ